MEQEKKTVTKTANDPQLFVKASEMTEKQFKALPRLRATLQKTKSKKGFTRCVLIVEIERTHLVISIQLSEARYNYLRLKLGREIFDKNNREIYDYPFLVPYRFIKGMNSNGEYKSIELIMGRLMYETYFFNDFNELGILEILEENENLKIDWYVRPDKVDVTQTVNSKWDD
ncbi:hypothetical protein ACAG96_04525 [Candidatus Izemoplasma sp. B36]|uniref:hypothetical protein n=1 Tax=Candidatus Izemoplasma sp. B36 TaxID=3242468 RepID=UPI003557E191